MQNVVYKLQLKAAAVGFGRRAGFYPITSYNGVMSFVCPSIYTSALVFILFIIQEPYFVILSDYSMRKAKKKNI